VNAPKRPRRPVLKLAPPPNVALELERQAQRYETTPEAVACFLIGQQLARQRRRARDEREAA